MNGRRILLDNDSYRGWRGVILWLSVRLCPRDTRFVTMEYSACQLHDRAVESPVQLVLDAGHHLRRHAVIVLAALLLIGLGTFEYAFTYSELVLALTWAAIGLLILAGTWSLAPRMLLVRGGCPVFLSRHPRTTVQRRLPLAMILLGASLMTGTATMTVQSQVFDRFTILGTLLSGACIVGLGVTGARRLLRGFRVCLYFNAVGAVAIAVGNVGWAIEIAPNAIAVVAATTTAIGCLLYGTFIRDLTRCFVHPSDTGSATEAAERPSNAA